MPMDHAFPFQPHCSSHLQPRIGFSSSHANASRTTRRRRPAPLPRGGRAFEGATDSGRRQRAPPDVAPRGSRLARLQRPVCAPAEVPRAVKRVPPACSRFQTFKLLRGGSRRPAPFGLQRPLLGGTPGGDGQMSNVELRGAKQSGCKGGERLVGEARRNGNLVLDRRQCAQVPVTVFRSASHELPEMSVIKRSEQGNSLSGSSFLLELCINVQEGRVRKPMSSVPHLQLLLAP